MANPNKKPDRKKRLAKARQPDQQHHQPSWKAAFLMAALATLASAVLFAQLFDRGGMLAAAMRSEFQSLAEPLKSTTGRQRFDRVSLADLYAARDAAIRSHPKAEPHTALAQLLDLLIAVNEGTEDAVQAAADAREDVTPDAENLVARLAVAVVVDLAGEETAKGGPKAVTPEERFAAFRTIVEAEPPARRATLYNAELTTAWYDVVRQFMRRPDVAISFAAAWPHHEINNQYTALPIIQRRLAALSAELRKAGQTEAAEHCTRWIAQFTLGLIDAEPDAGTRLLCADLLARSLEAESPAARGLRQFVDDFTAAAAASPIDICDQAPLPSPAVVPTAYRRAFYSLMFASILGLMAFGGAALFAVSCVSAVAVAIVRRSEPTAPGAKPPPIYVRLAGAALPPILLASLGVVYLYAYGLYSEKWGLVTGISSLAIGALVAIALASLYAAADQRAARRRITPVFLLALLGILLAIIPPPIVTRACRQVDLAVGTMWLLLPGLAVMIIAAIAICPARFRAIASLSAMVWCVNVCLAFAVLQYHRSADSRYQQAVVAARLDEVPARLGADWKERYLKAAAGAYDTVKP
jgi:hypothetical protein